MRVEMPSLARSMIESSKTIENNELKTDDSSRNRPDQDARSFIPAPLGSSHTYSLASLKASVDSYAKFLTVAENNLNAANHTPTIPRAILDRLNGE